MTDLAQALSQLKPSQIKMITNMITCMGGLCILGILGVCIAFCFLVWVMRYPHPNPSTLSNLDELLNKHAQKIVDKMTVEAVDP